MKKIEKNKKIIMTNTDKQNMFIIRWLHNVKYDGKKSEYPYGHVIYIFIMDIKTDCIFFSFFLVFLKP